MLPFSLIYGLGVSLRNFFYSQKLLKGVEFDLPVIAVGNLSVGGAGKTPHVEYIIRLLKDYLHIATLSRGYKRKTKGFRIGSGTDTVETLGDEPLQFMRKFPDVMVAVAENRMFAIPQMVTDNPELQVVLLDDAFQHRSVMPGLNILLTQHRLPFTRDWLLPSGRLREWRSAYRRADMIIVTKCPDVMNQKDRQKLIEEISPLPGQSIYFSKYGYGNPFGIFGEGEIELKGNMNVLLLCALANADYLADYILSKVNRLRRLEFEDHHLFSKYDMSRMNEIFTNWKVEDKIIITTDKDAARLELHHDFIRKHRLPIFILPAHVEFFEEDKDAFEADVRDFLLSFKV